MAKLSKNPRPTLKRAVDRTHRKIVFLLHKNECVTCGGTGVLQWAHVHSAEHEATRWSFLNTTIQCSGCNFNHEHDPWPLFRWYINRYGQDSLDDIQRRWHTDTPVRGLIRLREFHEVLKDLLAKLGNAEPRKTLSAKKLQQLEDVIFSGLGVSQRVSEE